LLLLLIVKVWFSVSPILLSPKSVLRSENERDSACFSLQQMGSNKSRQRAWGLDARWRVSIGFRISVIKRRVWVFEFFYFETGRVAESWPGSRWLRKSWYRPCRFLSTRPCLDLFARAKLKRTIVLEGNLVIQKSRWSRVRRQKRIGLCQEWWTPGSG